jgi:hypothetical protein
MLQLVPTPPHFRFFCVGCKQDFSSSERPAYAEVSRDAFRPYQCNRCAEVENARRSAA